MNNKRNSIKADIFNFGAKAIAYGSRMKVLEIQGKDGDPDPLLESIQSDMNALENKIRDAIDNL